MMFRFFDLPPEIRNAVYEWLFEGSTQRVVSLASGSSYIVTHSTSEHIHRFGTPAILRANRQLRSEAIGTFFTNTRMVATEAKLLKRWLMQLDPVHRALIQCVHLEGTLLPGWDVTDERVQLDHDRRLGYMQAVLRQDDLSMLSCRVEVKIYEAVSKELLWPVEASVKR